VRRRVEQAVAFCRSEMAVVTRWWPIVALAVLAFMLTPPL
jgi:hypothetical protein